MKRRPETMRKERGAGDEGEREREMVHHPN